MRLVSALLVRNEGDADRYLKRVLDRCAEFSDRIIVLDDRSTDTTCEIALQCPKVSLKHRKSHQEAWGQESPARAELWQLASDLAGDGWVLICDADMLLEGDPRPLCDSWDAGAWAFPLRDLWDSEKTFRVDGPWGLGPRIPRPWLFHTGALAKDFQPQWEGRGIHCGHCPANWPLPIAPTDILCWSHLAYLRPEHRKLKHAQYLRVADQLTPFEREHADSIMSPA